MSILSAADNVSDKFLQAKHSTIVRHIGDDTDNIREAHSFASEFYL